VAPDRPGPLLAHDDAGDDRELSAWLDDHPGSAMLAVFTGILTTARLMR
jgi:hypothetical protein